LEEDEIKMIEERVDLYIKIAAINRIKAYVKCRNRKVFNEYDAEVDKYLMMARIKLGIS